MAVWVLVACWLSGGARAASLRLRVAGPGGVPLSTAGLLARIAPRNRPQPAGGGFYVSDLDDHPAAGRPWLVGGSSEPLVSWNGPRRVRISLPWPIAEDGFSTVTLDNGGDGYEDGAIVDLQEAVAETEYRLFRESLRDRATAWEPLYKPGAEARALRKDVDEAFGAARAQRDAARRAEAFERALSRLAAAWGKALVEHGTQVAAHPRRGRALRWGLTLDETLPSRVSDFGTIAEKVAYSGSNWARIVFRANEEDFVYSRPRSFLEYDAAIAELERRKVHLLGSVLDSTQWTRSADAKAVGERTRNLVLHYRARIRSWEVASEPDGDWLGGAKDPLPEDAVLRSIREAAAQVKRVDPSLETVATLYWWEGTARDDRHPLFAWIDRTAPRRPFDDVDVIALSVYPDEHPFGVAFDPVFRKLRRRFPGKRLMLGGYGYVEGAALDGYWWFDPSDVAAARKDLVVLYTGAAAAIPDGAAGGFYFPALSTMLSGGREADDLLGVYRKTLRRMGR